MFFVDIYMEVGWLVTILLPVPPHRFMRKMKFKLWQRNDIPRINEHKQSLMKQRDHALKNKAVHERCLFTTLRNKVVKELRKAQATFVIDAYHTAKGSTKEINK